MRAIVRASVCVCVCVYEYRKAVSGIMTRNPDKNLVQQMALDPVFRVATDRPLSPVTGVRIPDIPRFAGLWCDQIANRNVCVVTVIGASGKLGSPTPSEKVRKMSEKDFTGKCHKSAGTKTVDDVGWTLDPFDLFLDFHRRNSIVMRARPRPLLRASWRIRLKGALFSGSGGGGGRGGVLNS